MTRPSIYHSQGYTCAEALIKSYNEEHNTDIPISIGSGMGVGMNVGSVCGAVNAAVVIIGYLNGRNSNLDENI
ncbi:C-GCAxxG-C-C family (seleno)protein, partial [Clostridioides difficile]